MDLNKIIQLMFEAPETNTGGTEELSLEETIDALATDEPVVDDKKDEEDLLTEEKPDKKENEEKEEEELELEPELSDEELNNVEDVPRKEILKKYPTIFKDFPQLERSYYREQKYAELLPTIEDAQTAVSKAENYDKFEVALLGGDIDQVLGSVKTADAKAFGRMVDNYLPALLKTDQAAYFHVINDVLKNTVIAMVREADNIKNDDLKAAAVILNQFFSGKSEFEAPKPFGPGKKDEPDELTTERQKFHEERFNTVLDELTTTSSNVVRSTVSKHIDPRNTMTDYVRKVAIDRVMDDLDKAIGSDKRHKAILDKLWQKAADSGYKSASKDDIKRAHLSKAKTLLPAIIQKRRSEALRGLGKRETIEREEPVRKGPVTVGRTATADNSGKGKEVPKNIKTLDFLMQD